MVESLNEDPNQGISIGHPCFKIGLSIESKGKEKSACARLITYVKVTLKSVFLLTIYDKSEQGNLTENNLKNVLSRIKD